MATHFEFIESEAERIRYEKNLHLLCEELHLDVEFVRTVYEDELNRFWRVAKVKDFLAIIVSRKVKLRLMMEEIK